MAKDELTELKKQYAKIKRKYKLPEFNTLNEEFEIEKLVEKKTDFLLKAIRRRIEERTENFLKVLEGFINPNFASMASLTLIKSFTEKEKKLVNNSYQILVGLVLKSGVLETEYNEKEEAEFIKDALKVWQEAKKSLHKLMLASEKIWRKKIEEEKKEIKYLG